MTQCITQNFRNKSTGEVNTAVNFNCYNVFCPFPSCTANVLICSIVFVCYECDILELGKIFLLDWIGSILIFCSVLYFLCLQSTVEKKGEKYWIIF